MKTNISPLKAGFTLLLAICVISAPLSHGAGTQFNLHFPKDVTDYHFLDRVDLIPHEAGHLLFSYLGEFPMILGGTIGQLLIPVGITIYFIAQQELYSSTVTLFWSAKT